MMNNKSSTSIVDMIEFNDIQNVSFYSECSLESGKNQFDSKDTDVLFASRLVQDARDLRNFEFKRSKSHISCYDVFLRKELSWIVQLTILVNLSLPFIEKPTDLVSIPYWIPCIIELNCLLIYSLRWLHLLAFQKPKAFWRDIKNWILLFTIVVSILVNLNKIKVTQY